MRCDSYLLAGPKWRLLSPSGTPPAAGAGAEAAASLLAGCPCSQTHSRLAALSAAPAFLFDALLLGYAAAATAHALSASATAELRRSAKSFASSCISFNSL